MEADIGAPAVSVLLPIRDGAEHLEACLDSLVSQTFGDLEIVVVDDGSTDGTAEILASWAGRDARLRLFGQGERGLVPALETARMHSRAPLLARMDADDVALPERLERQVAALASNPDWVVCGCGVRSVPRGEIRDGTRRYERWLNSLTRPDEIERDLFVECPLAHPTFMLRSAVMEAVGGYRDQGWPEDYDLLLRLWRAGGVLGTVPEPLLEWRDRPGRLSRVAPAYTPEAFRRCKVDHLAGSLLREREGLVVWGAGPIGKAFARTSAAAGIRVRAFVDLDPRKIGQQIHGAPVVAPAEVDRFRGALAVAAVGQPGAREEIRAALIDAGWRELTDFVAVA